MVAGLVFGISNTEVMPPTIAALLPEAKSSVSVEPGSLKCVWVSMQPGRTVSPLASIDWIASSSNLPIFTILLFWIPISPSLRFLSIYLYHFWLLGLTFMKKVLISFVIILQYE